MDMRGDHRRPHVVEEPKRTPWLAIILLILAIIAGWSVVSQLGLADRFRERAADNEEPVILIEEARLPVAVEAGEGAQPDGAAADAAVPRWVTQPVADFPAGTELPAKARVMLDCGVERDLTLGDCRVVEETPPGYGFARNAIEGAERARVSSRGPAGHRVRFTMHFVLPPA